MQTVILVNAILATFAFAAPVDHVRRSLKDLGHDVAHLGVAGPASPTATLLSWPTSIVPTSTAALAKRKAPMSTGFAIPYFNRTHSEAKHIIPTGTAVWAKREAPVETGYVQPHYNETHTHTVPSFTRTTPWKTESKPAVHPTGTAPSHHKAPGHTAPSHSKPSVTGTAPSWTAPSHSHPTGTRAPITPSSAPIHKTPASACSPDEKPMCNGPSMYGQCAYTDGHWRWQWNDVEDGKKCRDGEIVSSYYRL